MNKKLIVGLTVLATPFVVENVLEENIASANQTALATSKQSVASTQAAKSSEYVLNKPAKAYSTANDAAKRVNQKATYKAGSYYVYNQNKGMVNISKATGKPGSWINPVDSPNAKVASSTKPASQASRPAQTNTVSTTPSQVKGQYTLSQATPAYVNALDASRKVNAKGKVSAGNYHIFREYQGMLNVSKAKGKVGSWINPGAATAGQVTPVTPTKPAPVSTAPTQTVGNKTNAGLYALTSATPAYMNALDASKKVNTRGKVSAGNYYIFREYKGMLNISKAQGKPGSWINPGSVVTTTVVTETKPTSPKKEETSTKPTKEETVGTKTAAGTYTLKTATEVYASSTDASKKVNVKGMLAAGTYHIFREYKGMLNVSKEKGKVGSWINPNGKVTVTTPTQTVNNTKATPQNVKSPTYINGILLVNKKHPLPQYYNPGENKEAKTNFNNLRTALRNAGYGVSNSYSGFRSYNYQANLYKNYVARSGKAAADTFSARPGYSEHQTGLAFDLLDLNGQLLGSQGTTRASKVAADWVAKNAHNFGFIVRYRPGFENITGYQTEPWHLRYVGKKAASEIFRKNITLEAYLGAPGGDYIK